MYVLKVPKQSPNVFVRGELGDLIFFHYNVLNLSLKYCFKILEMNTNRYSSTCYKLQSKWLNLNKRTNCWARDVKELLEGLGFGNAWYNQCVGDKRYFLAIFKERVLILILKLGEVTFKIWEN